jgi:hypothetical protein
MNTSLRSILCVVDLTESSQHVLEVAAKMALAYKSQMSILFPYRLIDIGTKGDVATVKSTLEHAAREKFARLKTQVPILEQVSYEFHPEIGFTADRINFFLKRNKVDSVVISQRQSAAMNDVNPLGLQDLITNSRSPFTIVPEETDAKLVA